MFGFGWDHQLAYTKHRSPCGNLFFPLRAIALKSFKWRLTFFLPGCYFNSYSTADTSLLVSVSSAQKKHVKTTFPTAWQWVQYLNIAYLHAVRDIFFQPNLQLLIKQTVITLPGRAASWVIQYHSLCMPDTSKHINSQSQPPTKCPLIWFFFGKLKWRGKGREHLKSTVQDAKSSCSAAFRTPHFVTSTLHSTSPIKMHHEDWTNF